MAGRLPDAAPTSGDAGRRRRALAATVGGAGVGGRRAGDRNLRAPPRMRAGAMRAPHRPAGACSHGRPGGQTLRRDGRARRQAAARGPGTARAGGRPRGLLRMPSGAALLGAPREAAYGHNPEARVRGSDPRRGEPGAEAIHLLQRILWWVVIRSPKFSAQAAKGPDGLVQ